MKRNLLLTTLLVSLLTLTWGLTEGGWFQSTPEIEVLLSEALKSPKRIELPMAELVEQEGVWRTGAGEVARAEVLDELHKSLLALHVARVLENPVNRKEFFPGDLRFSLDDKVFEFGDISPSGDSFYLGIPGDKNVYVIDLRNMGSLAVADEENVLMHSKYQRLRDLLLYPEDRWREERLLPLIRISSFEEWRKGELVLNGANLLKHVWGKAIMQAFLAGLQSLQVKGTIQTQKPAKPSKVGVWEFVIDQNEKMVWEFFEHPSLPILYVWIPSIGKAYPLNEDSSDFVQHFPERLLDRPFPMRLGDESRELQFEEAGEAILKDSPPVHALKEFYGREQTFDHLSLLGVKDCENLTKTARFVVRNSDTKYYWRRVTGGWAVLECATGLAWSWSLPLDSKMNFASLKGKG